MAMLGGRALGLSSLYLDSPETKFLSGFLRPIGGVSDFVCNQNEYSRRVSPALN
jgi:hypothetical protein